MKISLGLIILVFCFSSPIFAADAQHTIQHGDGNPSREGNQTFHLYDNIDLLSKIKFNFAKQNVVAKSVFPQLVSSDGEDYSTDDFNDAITTLIKEEFDAFVSQVKSVQFSQTTIPKTKLKNNLYIDYNASILKSGKDHLISVRFVIQGVIAGKPHSYHYHRVLNYDLENNEMLNLDDIFLPNSNYLNVISDYSRNILLSRLKNKELIMNGTVPNELNFRNWNLKPTGILFTFDEYQVAPSSRGTQTVLIKYTELEELISSNSPLEGCIKNPKTCLRSNLLMNGFIDEAVYTPRRLFNPALSKL